MGIIVRQSIKQSLVTYAGTIIGMLNILFIYPLCYRPDQQGLFRILVDTALLIAPFMTLGISGIVVRFFPTFRDDTTGHRGYLGSLLVVEVGFFVLALLLLLPFLPSLIDWYAKDNALLQSYLGLAIALAFLSALTYLFSEYISNFGRTAVPAALNQSIKLTQPVLALLYYSQIIPFSVVVYGFVGSFVLILLLMMGYVHIQGQLHLRPRFEQFTPPLLRSMGQYSLFTILGSIGTMLVIRLDALMLTSMISLTATGVFSIAGFIAEAIGIPSVAIAKISAPVLSKAWAEGNRHEIGMIYKKSSLLLLMVGLFLFLNIWLNIKDVFRIMPNGQLYEGGLYVVGILGVAKLIDMVTSVNTEIIAYSRWYRFNLLALLVLGAFNVACNLYLIPLFQLNGVALASLLSIALFNVVKLLFIYTKMGIHPFQRQTLYVLGLGLVSYLGVAALPLGNLPPMAAIALRSVLVSSLYVASLLYFRISPDFNALFTQTWRQFSAFVGWK